MRTANPLSYLIPDLPGYARGSPCTTCWSSQVHSLGQHSDSSWWGFHWKLPIFRWNVRKNLNMRTHFSLKTEHSIWCINCHIFVCCKGTQNYLFLDTQTLEDEGTLFLWNVGNCWPSGTLFLWNVRNCWPSCTVSRSSAQHGRVNFRADISAMQKCFRIYSFDSC